MAIPCNDGFLLNSQHKFFVDSTPLEVDRTWNRLAKGIHDFDDGLNEEVEDYFPIAYDGAGASVVLNILFSISFSGHRFAGDPAQDYILGQGLTVGVGRETNLIWQFPSLDGYYGKVVMSKIGPPKGEANSKSEFEVEFKLYGNPQYSEAPSTPDLLIVGATNSTVSLQWSMNDNESTDGFSYQVYRDGNLIVETFNKFYMDVGLTPNTIYSYYIVAITPVLANSEPSSTETIKTDSVTLIIDFIGKIQSSVIENPNIFWTRVNQTSLVVPSQMADTISQFAIDQIKSLDGAVDNRSTTTNLAYGQQAYSFDLIQDTERNYGPIPGASVAQKVIWLKANILSLQFDYYGWASSVSGNKVSVSSWKTDTSAWDTPLTHTNGTITNLSILNNSAVVPFRIDNNGFCHFISYADPSNGTIASSVRSDYAKLTITYLNTP